MLSGEGNENGEKTTKKKLLDVQHTFFCTFLCRCFTRLQRETSRNFLVTRFIEEISYLFLFTLFFHCRSFSPWWPLAFLIFSGAKFSNSSSTKNCLLCFSSLSLALCRAFYRLASMACRLLSLFLCLSLSLYSKLFDMTINLSLILKITRIRKPFLLSVLIFIDSLFSASQRRGWLCDFPPK